MSTLSTHVLDTAQGRPAEGMEVTLEARVAEPHTTGAREATDGSEAIPIRRGDGATVSDAIQLHPGSSTRWRPISTGTTDEDGRIPTLMPEGMELSPGTYRLTFHTGDYLQRTAHTAFYPSVAVEFAIADATDHYHVPLLISPFGYSTYRGS